MALLLIEHTVGQKTPKCHVNSVFGRDGARRQLGRDHAQANSWSAALVNLSEMSALRTVATTSNFIRS